MDIAAPAALRRSRFRWPVHPGAVVIALPVTVALLTMLAALLRPDPEVWGFILDTVLPSVLPTTLILAVGTTALATVIGVACAWVTSVYEFPGRRWLTGALVLPLAIPAYLLATVYIGWLDYAGPVATAWRSLFGDNAWFPPVRSTGGAMLTLALALYPYVYLLARNAFLSQGRRAMEVAASLGLSPWAGFRRVGLPLARPWIAGGALLVMMETLADFGAVSAFNVRTLTTAIYQSWFALFSIDGALALACVLVAIALIVAEAERRQRAGRGFTGDAGMRNAHRHTLSGWRGWAASGGCLLLVAIAAAAPLTQLTAWAIHHRADADWRLLAFAGHSLALAAMAAAGITAMGLWLAWIQRHDARRSTGLVATLATAGYAVPGTVLAVALFVPLAAVSGLLSQVLTAWQDAPVRVALHTGLATLLIGYAARFLTVAHKPIAGQWLRVTPSVEDMARGLGYRGWALARHVHMPILAPSLFTAAALVFVDVMKELPLTLMTRPYGWDTLAIRVFEMTAEGEWSRAALPGLAIVVVGLVPVLWLVGQSGGRRDAA